jgi:hypothetical protein
LSAIGRTTTMAQGFSAHCRDCAIKASSDLAKRRTASDPARDVLSLSLRERRQRTAAIGGAIPPRGSNTQRMQLCGLSKVRPISCSGCPAFHRHQTSFFSIAESPIVFLARYNTTFREQTYSRWCCIDLLRTPRFLGPTLLEISGNPTSRDLGTVDWEYLPYLQKAYAN